MPLSAACKLKRPSPALGSPAIKGRILVNFSPAKTQIPRRCGELFLSLLCTILSLVSRNCIGTRGPCKLQFTRTKSNPQSDSESNEINRIAFFILRQDWGTRPHTAPMPLVSHPFREDYWSVGGDFALNRDAGGKRQTKAPFPSQGF